MASASDVEQSEVLLLLEEYCSRRSQQRSQWSHTRTPGVPYLQGPAGSHDEGEWDFYSCLTDRMDSTTCDSCRMFCCSCMFSDCCHGDLNCVLHVKQNKVELKKSACLLCKPAPGHFLVPTWRVLRVLTKVRAFESDSIGQKTGEWTCVLF